MSNNRLVLCTFYEENGRLFDSNLFFLKSLIPFSKKLILIVNGEINDDAKNKLSGLGISSLIRENKGLDFGAWQEAILYLGWDEICSYDDLLITNLTCYGPVYPLQELFDEMDNRHCDFWGINRHPAMPHVKLIPSDPSSSIQEHIQSYFVNFKQNVLLSEPFQNFWNKLKQASSYQEEVAYHESRLTFFLESSGFISSTYMPFMKYKRTNANASLLEGLNQLVEDRNPFIKKKIFSLRQDYWLNNGNWGQCVNILQYIRDKTSYSASNIIQEMLATVPMSTIQTNLHLTYQVDSINSDKSLLSKSIKLGLVFFAFYEDQVQYNLSYIFNFPKDTFICLLSARTELLDIYEIALKENGFNNIEKREIPPRGRDVSAYIVGAQDVYQKADYICCLHDKKTSQAGYLVGTAYRNHNIENLVATRDYITNIIREFEKDPFLGMLVPPTYPLALGNEMSDPENRRILLELYKDYSIRAPFDEIPLAPYGTMFWVRGIAFQTLKRKTLNFEDFPKEPNSTDGTILHAFERFYPALVQESGFYIGWCGTAKNLKWYFDLAFYVWREYQKRLYSVYGFMPLPALLESISLQRSSPRCGVRKAVFNLLKEIKFRLFPEKSFPRLSAFVAKVLKI